MRAVFVLGKSHNSNPNRKRRQKFFLFFYKEKSDMWNGSSDRPSWWPPELPDIFVTDSMAEIKEKLNAIPSVDRTKVARKDKPLKKDGQDG